MNTAQTPNAAAPVPVRLTFDADGLVSATIMWQGERVNVRIALDLSGQTGLIPGMRPNGAEMPSVRVHSGPRDLQSCGVYPVRNVYLDAPHQGEGMSLFGSVSPTPARMERLLAQIGVPPILTLDGVRAAIREERTARVAACPGHVCRERTEVAFCGPIQGAVPNPRAHGGRLATECCACGAQRRTNVNGIYVERGAWS